jgi:hypothetical protein
MADFSAHWNRRHDVEPVLQEFDEVRERGKTRPHDYVILVDLSDSTFDTVQRYELG